MQIISLSFIAYVVVFVTWVVLELRGVRRWIRRSVVCLFPVLFVVGTLEWNAYHTVRDSKSGSLLDTALEYIVVGLEEGRTDNVLSTVQKVRRAGGGDVHVQTDKLHGLLYEQVIRETDPSGR